MATDGAARVAQGLHASAAGILQGVCRHDRHCVRLERPFREGGASSFRRRPRRLVCPRLGRPARLDAQAALPGVERHGDGHVRSRAAVGRASRCSRRRAGRGSGVFAGRTGGRQHAGPVLARLEALA
eukprot:scaffold50210_cov63-Phaeocystis_antarctica.AAC.1